MIEKPKIFRKGDTATAVMEISQPLPEGITIKAGIYTPYGKPLYETTWPDGDIQKVDDTLYILELDYGISQRMQGAATFRFTLYNSDLSYVNSAEDAIPLVWEDEPVNRNLKKSL